MTETIPEISVVITTYNNEEYIAKAVKSVLEQSFQNFEAIIVDDGSQDKTKEIVQRLQDPQVRYIYQEHSGLPACARNRGMEMARGRYIAILDGDDFWHKDKLKRCKDALDACPDAGLVCHNLAMMHGDEIKRVTTYGPYVDDMYKKLLFEGNCLGPTAVVMRRNIFSENGFRFSEEKNLFAIEDYEYWLQLSRTYKFCFIPDILGYHRVTDDGATLSRIEYNTVNMLNLLESHFSNLGPISDSLAQRIRRRKSSVMEGAGRMYLHKNDFKKSRYWYSGR